MRVLKLGCKMGGPNPLLLREKLGVGSSLLTIWHWAEGGVEDERVSQRFLSYLYRCGYFPILLMCRSHSASFWVSLTGN